MTVDSLTFPQIAAHRFGPWLAGESTLASAEIAVAGGITVLETDFAVTADGVAILSHGLTLDDSTNGTGTVADLTYAQIVNTVQVDPAAMLPGTGYVNQPVATVDELLKAHLGRAVILLENKLTQGNGRIDRMFKEKLSTPAMIEELYLATFARLPTAPEVIQKVDCCPIHKHLLQRASNGP